MITVLLVVVGPAGHCYHHAPKVKPEAATAVVELLMMSVKTFSEVSHPQALLGSLMSISRKFQFTKIVSEFVINF